MLPYHKFGYGGFTEVLKQGIWREMVELGHIC